MTTATRKRSLEKTGIWSSVFPTEQVTEQQSALFVKRLLAVSISNITYLRAIFPEHAFGDRCLEDLNLKILHNDSSCPGACQVITWMKGCFDALDKKYLRMLTIGTVIESYTFKFTYSDEAGVDIYRNKKKISSAHSAAETKKATIRLLRTIVVLTQTLQSLPDDVMMTMKLFYYDDCTPADYEPPGFKACESDSFTFEEEPMNIKVGDVTTPFHSVKLRIKTDGKQLEMMEDPNGNEAEMEERKNEISDNGLDEEMEITNNPTVETELRIDEVKEKTHVSTEQWPGDEVSSAAIPSESPAKPVKSNGLENLSNDPTVMQDENAVRCPCGCNEEDGLMIMCSVCKFWQHGVCFCVTEEDDAPEDHICDVCAKPGEVGKEPTDPQLCDMTSVVVQATCLWRKALMACLESSRVLAPQLARRLGIEVTIAQGLVNRLEKEGFVQNQKRGKRLGNVINQDKIKKDGISKYLRKEKKETTTQNVEISALVKQTEKITLSGIRNLKQKEKDKEANKSHPDSNTNMKHVRGKKRALSRIDHSKEFELDDSQDSQEPCRTRRRKTSVVSQSILV
ncbi:HORMA domain-containing protein 1-like isoform X2 [Gigantopelta aegis]|uniref:HORMA domain-containing protein 1-like isoform X2 n=1 Tax=Gigantopelta aegis TaxID=1735272 RepID=UPI001B88E434|nr:HORMA domain-containing protein 1-like isoform X2 [Gigantopelta aegis]